MHLPVIPTNPAANPITNPAPGPGPAPAPDRGEGEKDAAGFQSHLRDLTGIVRGEVRLGLHDRMLYATDASLYQVEPMGVVIPADVEDAVSAARACIDRGLPILPRGGGTSLAGQCTNHAVVIDLSPNCRRVLALDPSARTCDVEPGIALDDLNTHLAPHGLFFAPDPATSRHANIGGCIGNNAAGSRSVRYGRTSENLLGLSALLGTGERVTLYEGAGRHDPVVGELSRRVAAIVTAHATEIRARFPKTIRRNAGYALDMMLDQLERSGNDPLALNLAHLLCGSEGTLALTLGARLKLHPIPRAKGLATIAFASVDEAIDAVMPILATQPSAVELLDDTVIDLARANTEYARYVDLMPNPSGGGGSGGGGGRLRAVLYVEYFADSTDAQAELEAKFQTLRARVPADAIKTYTEPGPMLQAWKLRKAGEPLLHGVPGRRKPVTFVEDNAVPPERLGEFVRKFRAIVESHGTKAAFWAHASVGVLHVRPFIDVKDEGDRARMVAIAQEVAELARSVGGVMSGEHGDGRVRGPLLESFYGSTLMGAFREIKALFDPQGLLNPGNIVAPGPLGSIVEHLRIAPVQASRPAVVPEIDAYFSYEDQHGFDGAVEMCNGAGVCRKKSGGTMCPSYMGTLDERHSTRGRANALRLAITGQLSTGAHADAAPAWNDPETIKTLDLCLSCKACKSECPSNVDIARLKAEYTAQRYKREEPPLSVRILSQARRLGWLATRTPALANAVNNSVLGRRAINRVLGFHPKRSIPAFATPLPALLRRAGLRVVRRPTGKRPAIALFGDCFAMFNEPGIGQAAARVLTRLGYEIVLADAGCCARPAISLGLLDQAISTADRTIARLKPLIESEAVRAIVVFEPSCLSAFKDDWMKLKLTSPVELRRALASKSMLVEDFIDKAWDQHPAIVAMTQDDNGPFAAPTLSRWRDPALGPVLLHAHCHQKSLWGAETSARLLARFVGPRLRVLDSGCCGMAGAFGYAHDRYDLSMKIGELSLFPAVREACAPIDASRARESAPAHVGASSAAGDAREGGGGSGGGGASGVVVAPGTSCRHQIHDGTSRVALHPIELVDRMLSDARTP